MASDAAESAQDDTIVGDLIKPVFRTQATINWIVRYSKLIEKKLDTTKPCPRNRSSVFRVPPRNELGWFLEVVASSKSNGTNFIGLYLRLLKKKVAKIKPVLIDIVFEAVDNDGQVSRKLELTRQKFDLLNDVAGFENFIEADVLENSNLLKDGNLTIKCSISIVTEAKCSPRVQSESIASSTDSPKKAKKSKKRKAAASCSETISSSSDTSLAIPSSSTTITPPTKSPSSAEAQPAAKKSWNLFANAIKRMN